MRSSYRAARALRLAFRLLGLFLAAVVLVESLPTREQFLEFARLPGRTLLVSARTRRREDDDPDNDGKPGRAVTVAPDREAASNVRVFDPCTGAGVVPGGLPLTGEVLTPSEAVTDVR